MRVYEIKEYGVHVDLDAISYITDPVEGRYSHIHEFTIGLKLHKEPLEIVAFTAVNFDALNYTNKLVMTEGIPTGLYELRNAHHALLTAWKQLEPRSKA